MGRAPCCQKVGLKTGRWTAEEDEILTKYIHENGEGSWRSLPKNAGLLRCGKSCRLRWTNYLRGDVKRGNISKEEEDIIINLHASLGNKWSFIASQLPGRTDNEIKNYWNSHLSRRIDTFRRPKSEPLPIIMNLIQLDKKTAPKRKRGRTSRAAMKNNKSYNYKDAIKVKETSSSQKEVNNKANNDVMPSMPPQTPTLEKIDSIVMDSRAVPSPYQGMEEGRECGIKNSMMCPTGELSKSESEIFGPYEELENDFLMSFSDIIDSEILLDPNAEFILSEERETGIINSNGESRENGIVLGSSCATESADLSPNGEIISEWFSNSSSTMTTSCSDEGLMGDWEWENVVHGQEPLNDNQEEVISWLWEADSTDYGRELIDNEKQKAAIVAWLLS